jgi:hypothetical protein
LEFDGTTPKPNQTAGMAQGNDQDDYFERNAESTSADDPRGD